jgi:signal transduction histidine kinase
VESKPRSWDSRVAEIEMDETAACHPPFRSAPATKWRGNQDAFTLGLGNRLPHGTCDALTSQHLAEHAARLARKNEALEDFAGLIAHDLRSMLVAGLLSGSTRDSLMRGLELVDSILEAVHADRDDGRTACLTECLREAFLDIGEPQLRVLGGASDPLPVPPNALRYVLRNMLTNALAAGADRVDVSALACGDRHVLAIDDNGVGLGESRAYATGSGLGVELCRRLLSRFRGTLELRQGSMRGSRALIVLTGSGR